MYTLEFILNTYNISVDTIKNSLIEFGEDLEVIPLADEQLEKARGFQVHMRTEEPEVVFDACAELGRIKSIKISECTT